MSRRSGAAVIGWRCAGTLAVLIAAAVIAQPRAQATPSVSELFTKYADGQYDVAAELRRIPASRVLADLGPLHKYVSGESVNPWRRRLLASFALEAAYETAHNQGINHLPKPRGDLRDQPTYTEALVQFSAGCLGGPATLLPPFRERWFHAAIAVLERAQQAKALERIVDAALNSFPGQPRFVLAYAVAAEIRTSPYAGVSESAAQGRLNEATARFVEARALTDVAPEAGVRLGFLAFRSGDATRSVKDLESIEPELHDPALQYLARLFRGRALSALGRPADAEAAFRSALELVPGAQSAQLGLATTRVDQQDPAGASDLADAVLKRPTSPLDPWWNYWIGDARMWTGIVQALRQEIK